MTEHTKRPDKFTLSCHWVEEERFDVLLSKPPVKEPKPISDTSFLLKSKGSPPSPRLPGN
jgi:hypothetical protein